MNWDYNDSHNIFLNIWIAKDHFTALHKVQRPVTLSMRSVETRMRPFSFFCWRHDLRCKMKISLSASLTFKVCSPRDRARLWWALCAYPSRSLSPGQSTASLTALAWHKDCICTGLVISKGNMLRPISYWIREWRHSGWVRLLLCRCALTLL